MIPKLIHYCWFGKNPLPEDARRCIASWRKYCPDYQIIEWNESNYDVTTNPYMYEAYQAEKWAFVSDYARIDIIYQHGGIYFDTDVELLKPLDALRNDPLFCGWESNVDETGENNVAFGLGFGAEPQNCILKEILNIYSTLSFYNQDGTFNLAPCSVYQTMALKKHGLNTEKMTLQRLEYGTVYPCEYFSPKNYYTGEVLCTANTYSIHHYTALWLSPRERNMIQVRQKMRTRFGNKRASAICNHPIFYFFEYLYTEGPVSTFKRVGRKLKR